MFPSTTASVAVLPLMTLLASGCGDNAPADPPTPPAANACNPCGAKAAPDANACNPCGAKTANACNPCGAGGQDISADLVKQPNGVALFAGDTAALVAKGATLFSDKSLSSTGAMACATCHTDSGSGPYGAMMASFAQPYPHKVTMAAQRSGVDSLSAAEMVQFCMLAPMAAKTLAWDGEQLAALTAYVESVQPGFKPTAAAPAANACNPCGAKAAPAANACNPCGQ